MGDQGYEAAKLIDEALGTVPGRAASLSDIEHIVILMQENRSFDCYFGTLSGVRGFSDPNVPRRVVGGVEHPVFDQFGFRPGTGPDPAGYMQPFYLDSGPPLKDGEATNDIAHGWAVQHESWNGGALDGFLRSHLETDGPANGPVTMGHYTRADLAFYYALADAFTICDGYHCSVLGPTDPNRLIAMSGTIDPDGEHGGPVVRTIANRVPELHKLSWETMPERLLDAGVSWKVYNSPLGLALLSPLPYFKAYDDPMSHRGRELMLRGMAQLYPHSFHEDIEDGTLPSVSWIIPPLAQCEHPAAPPEFGEHFVQEVLRALVSNPEIWERTAVFIVYDENGGFFDHVPPLTAPPGTPGEWLTTSPPDAKGIAGPIGLGFRTPCLVISPFSRGGYLCSDLFDHTSLLKFIERRFGVEAPNLSAWRRAATGDLTSAFAFAKPPDPSLPRLPVASLGECSIIEQAVVNSLAGMFDKGICYPLPDHNQMPVQETSPPRPPVPSAPPVPSRTT